MKTELLVAAAATVAVAAAKMPPTGPGWYMSFYNENCAQACERQANWVAYPEAQNAVNTDSIANVLHANMFRCETNGDARLVNHATSPGVINGRVSYVNKVVSRGLGHGKKTNRFCCCAWDARPCPPKGQFRELFTADKRDPHCGKYERQLAGVVPLYPSAPFPTKAPVTRPTPRPTKKPTVKPTKKPTEKPTDKPTAPPTVKTGKPTKSPTMFPTKATKAPTNAVTKAPTNQPVFLGCRRADTEAQCSALPQEENCGYAKYSDLMNKRVRPLQQARNQARNAKARNRITRKIRDVRMEYASCVNGCQNLSACGAICKPLCMTNRVPDCEYNEDLMVCQDKVLV